MRILSYLAILAAVLIPVAAHADTLSYNLSFSGSNGGGSKANGTGTLSVDTTDSSITAFTFSATVVDTDQAFTSTYTYGLSDVQFYLISLDPTSSFIASMSIHTTTKTGSNASAPKVFFASSYPSNTDVSYFNSTVTTDNGTLVLTPAAASPVPEPSSLMLFGTGAFGCIVTARRRLLRA